MSKKHDKQLNAIASAAAYVRIAREAIDQAERHIAQIEIHPIDVRLMQPDLKRLRHHVRVTENLIGHLQMKVATP